MTLGDLPGHRSPFTPRPQGWLVCALLVALPGVVLGAGEGNALARARLGRKLPAFAKSPAPVRELLHVNLLNSPDDERLALTVLQGLVNRKQPRIYITQNPGWHGPAGIPKSVEGLKARGHAFRDVEDPLSLVAAFKDCVRGAALYESDLKNNPAALHKLNALTLYCALNDALPITPELNEKLRLPVLFDARGKLNDAAESYEWAYRELWPKANHRALAITCPTHIVLRDYLVANRIMPVWISSEMSGAAEEMCLRFLNETEPNSPLMGCWGGYGEEPAGRVSEADLQRLASLRGKFIVVTDGCFNLTVHSGLPFRLPAARPPRPAAAPLTGKVYVCFTFTDGDNLQYLQQYFRSAQWWGNPARGKVPLAWSLSPSAAELIPDVVEDLMATKTDNDEFVCSTAGTGLMTPALYGRDLYANHSALYSEYLKLTGLGMNASGLRAAHLGDTSGVPWTRADFDEWAKAIPAMDGILGDYGPARGVFPSDAALFTSTGAPVVRAVVAPGHGAPDENSAKEFADAVRAATPASRPAFVHVCLINWFNSPQVVADAVRLLGPDYEPVLPSRLFDLLRASRTKGSR